MGLKRVAVLGGIVLGTAGAAALATAAITGIIGADGAINGCYQKENGQLRVVASGSACKPSELPISWQQRGPAGERGPAGATGPAGRGLENLSDFQGLPCATPGGPGTVDLAVDSEGAITMRCSETVALDRFEPNNIVYTHLDVSQLPLAVQASIFPAGDNDIYEFTCDRAPCPRFARVSNGAVVSAIIPFGNVGPGPAVEFTAPPGTNVILFVSAPSPRNYVLRVEG